MKIARKFMKIFGSNAGPQQRGKFGSLAAGLPEFATDPEDIQSLSNYEAGWYGAILGNNSPAIQDMNALQFLFAYQIAYGLQAGIPEWDDDTDYHIGDICRVGMTLYSSVANDNLDNDPVADTDQDFWVEYSTVKTGVVQEYSGATAPRGYVLASGQTIGSAASGATRAKADTRALFNLYWTDYDDLTMPIFEDDGSPSTRGASADADWSANKRMSTPDRRGRVAAGKDDMGGSAAGRLTTAGSGIDGEELGAAGGSQQHTLTSPELPSHSHPSGTLAIGTSGSHAHSIQTSGNVGANRLYFAGAPSPFFGTSTDAASHAHPAPTMSGSAGATGSGNAHQNVQPTIVENFIIKL